MGKTALVVGATGAVGREIVRGLCVSLSRAHLGLGRWGGLNLALTSSNLAAPRGQI